MLSGERAPSVTTIVWAKKCHWGHYGVWSKRPPPYAIATERFVLARLPWPRSFVTRCNVPGGGGTTAWKNMTRMRESVDWALRSAVSLGRFTRPLRTDVTVARGGRYTRSLHSAITLGRYTQSVVTLIGRYTLSTVTRFATRSCRPIHVTLGRPTRPLHSAVTLGRYIQSAVTLIGRYILSTVTLTRPLHFAHASLRRRARCAEPATISRPRALSPYVTTFNECSQQSSVPSSRPPDARHTPTNKPSE